MIFTTVVIAAGVLGQGDAAVIGSLLASLTAVGVCWMQGVKTRAVADTADVQAKLEILDSKVDTILGYYVDHEARIKGVERNARWE
jgi:hypothetical protein